MKNKESVGTWICVDSGFVAVHLESELSLSGLLLRVLKNVIYTCGGRVWIFLVHVCVCLVI